MSLLEMMADAWPGKDRRQHERVSGTPIKVKLAGASYKSLDWSLGGCRIQGLPERFRTGDMMEGTIAGIGFSHSGECVAEVVWRKDNGQVGLRWLELEPHVFERLSILRGRFK